MTESPRTFDIPLGRMFGVAPGLPVTSMAHTIEYYGKLGFQFVIPPPEAIVDADFGIAKREGVELHFAVRPQHDPATTATWVYVRVADADELAAELGAAGIKPRREPHDTDYGMREFALIDPDGNLLLFGNPLETKEKIEPPTSTSEDRGHDPVAFEFATAIKRADVDRVRALLADDPTLATSVINSYRPLHLFADAPGYRPNAVAMVAALLAAGADIDAHAPGTWHHETALHWAASNDDVELIDALLDAGADIEHPGSSIGGGPPIQSALGYAQWQALRRLYERGATIGLSEAAALGLLPMVTSLAEADPAPDDLSVALWNACRAGRLDVARYLAGRGADVRWPAPWSGELPLDVARAGQHRDVVAWLTEATG